MEIDRSTELFEKLQALEGTLPAIEAGEMEAVNDPQIQGLVLRTVTAEKILRVNDPRIKELQKELQDTAKSIQDRKEAYRRDHSSLGNQLSILTSPVIDGIVSRFKRMGEGLRLDREVVGKRYDGVFKRTILKVQSNEDALREFHQRIKEAVAKISGMTFESITAIEAEANRLNQELKDFNPNVFTEKEMDENDYFRGTPPQGADPTYIGPRSGLPL
jgi:hypothetical protein